MEYLTLAVGNAKSHPISPEGHHESAIAFLTDLEEKLEVAQVQLQIWNTLEGHINDGPEVQARISLLTTQLFTMSEVSLLVCFEQSLLMPSSSIKSSLFRFI